MRSTHGRRHRHERLVPLAAAVLALVASSCTTGDKIDPPTAAPAATSGGRMVVGISEPTSLEPSNAADPSAALVVGTMCDPLIQIDPRTGALKGAVAESWQVTDGGKRFTIKLRKGVRFHNGSELTSDDAVFALSRVASEEAASPLAPLLRAVEGYAQVHGDEEVDEERNRRILRGLRIIEKYSFEVNLTEAHADMINLLAHPLSSPVPKKLVEADPAAFAARPVCAGPYQLSAPWRHGDAAITVRRFPGYKPVNEGYTAAGRGYLNEIEFRVIEDQDAQVAKFDAGGLDVAHVPRLRLPEVRQRHESLVTSRGPILQYIGLPTRVAPFNRPGTRRSLSQALDRRSLAAVVEGGAAVPAHGFLPPTLGAAHRRTACDAATQPRSEVVHEAATSIAGTPLKLYFNDEFGHRQLAEAVASQWKSALGLEVQLVPQSWEAHLAKATSPLGFDGAFLMSWGGPYASPDAYLAPLFESSRIGNENFSQFDNDTFDGLLQRVARRSLDAKERRLDYQQLEDFVCREMPVVPLNFGLVSHLVRRHTFASARGTFTDLSTGDVLLRELYVKPAPEPAQ